MVAAATGSLCEAANAAVQGNASEEKLIASAKAVANSTAQLLLACRVKADPTSLTQKRLQVSKFNYFYSLFYCLCDATLPRLALRPQSIIYSIFKHPFFPYHCS